eukprot:7068629-Pyramimonas_sp.AAC.1
MGRRLQLIRHRDIRDYVPVHARLLYDRLAVCNDNETEHSRERWDRDALVHAPRHGDQKHTFLTQLNDFLRTNMEEWVRLGVRKTPDDIFAYLEKHM